MNRLVQLTRVALIGSCFLVIAGCRAGGTANDSSMKNNLGAMSTADITIAVKYKYKVWLARTSAEQQTGLMNTTLDELPADHGMLFVFDSDQQQGFWMHNTIIPLDIAYIRSDGTIVKIYTMKALDESTYPSIEPAQFALEVRAGQFSEKGVHSGDHVDIPATVIQP